MQLISYAQNYEDVRLWRAFRDTESGRYLDIGTQDPVHDSVSRLFYERGWRGVHAEPTPHYAAAMRDARPDEKVIEAAVSCSQAPMVLFEIPNTGLSTGVPEIAKNHEKAGWSHREILVPTISLECLLDHMGQDPIHWLKIDVEGMEADVLTSWGNHPARPAALIVEATAPNTQEPTHHVWKDMVTQRGYQEVLFDGLSLYFVHETEIHRAEDLALSPNVFDGFQVLHTHFSAQHVAAETDRVISELQSEAEAQEQTHSDQMAEAAAAAVNASAQLDAANARAAGMDERLQEQAQLHSAAISRATEKTSEVQRELEESTCQLAAIQTEQLALTRLTGRLEGKLEAQEQHYAANMSAATTQREELRRDLKSVEQELASLRDLAADLRAQLAAQKEASNALLEAAKGEAAEIGAALQSETESLRTELALRDRKVAEAEGLLVDMPDPLGGISGLQQVAVRWLIGARQVSEMAGHQAAALEWCKHARAPALEADLGGDDCTRNYAPQDLYAHPISVGEPMLVDEGPITSVAQLLAPHDRSFIHAAYRSVLGRPPEPEGEAYYLARLRSGVHKLDILKQLRHSPEGRSFVPGVAGLDRALKHRRFATLPIVGAVFRFFSGAEGNSATQRQLRVLANEIGRHGDAQASLATLIRDVSEQIANFQADKPEQTGSGAPERQSITTTPQATRANPASLELPDLPMGLASMERKLFRRLNQHALNDKVCS